MFPMRAKSILTAVLSLMIFSLSASAIDLNLKNVTVEQALAALNKAGNYSIVLNSGDVDLSRKVSVKAKDATVKEVLGQILAGQDVSITMEGSRILVSKKAAQEAQPQKSIKGQVTDAVTGEPVIGASIIQKGTDNGVIADIDGNFSFAVPEGTPLVVSSIGYKSVEVAAQSVLNIKLKEDVLMLQESVVVGYGTALKKDVSGAVAHTDLSTLKESPNLSLANSLQGVIPGLNVSTTGASGTAPDMTIRGQTTISGTKNPLIVLDGIIFRGNMVDINPGDIESVDVLKDASACAIYGSQAANGVIIITSKHTKEESKPIIEYNGSFAFQQMSNPNHLNTLNRAQYLDLVTNIFLDQNRLNGDIYTLDPSWSVAAHMQDQKSSQGTIDGNDTDWWGMFLRDVPYMTTHDIGIRGRSKRTSYYMSFGYTDQKNITKYDMYKRYNVRINLETSITDWLKIGTNTFFTLSDETGREVYPHQVYNLPPVCAAYEADGSIKIYPFRTQTNPLAIAQDRHQIKTRVPLVATFYLDADIPFVKGLNYRFNLSEYYEVARQQVSDKWACGGVGEAFKDLAVQHDWTLDNILTYKRSFGDHFVNATLVYGAEKRHYDWFQAYCTNYENILLGSNYLQAAASGNQYGQSNAWEEQSIYSMARLNYTFKDRYILTATVRRDGFSGFGDDNKFATFPSVAAAWRISEENFMKNAGWIDDLKLRLSWGESGNRTLGRYSTLATVNYTDGYIYGDGVSSVEKSINVSRLANGGLKWESTRTLNGGLDFSFLNNRLYGSLDAYYSHTYNMLYDVAIPSMNNGQASYTANLGKMDNHGIELTITGVPVKTKDWSWDVTFNFSRNRNKVVSILGPDNDQDGDGKEDDLPSSNVFIGQPASSIYTYELDPNHPIWSIADYEAGLVPSQFSYGTYHIIDQNNDGRIDSTNDRTIIGYRDPSYRFSILNTVRYRNWEFKMFINSVQGGKNYYLGSSGDGLYVNEKQNTFAWDYWTPEHQDAKYARPGFTPPMSKAWQPYWSRSFVRLQDVTLSYTLPSSLLQKAKIQGLKVYLSGKNLLTISNWDGWDPETGDGWYRWTYPVMKSYSLGVSFSF